MTVISEAPRFVVWLIKYLGFRIGLWILLSLCLYGIWAGFDGLLINFSSNTLREISIQDVEKNGVGGSRYVKITGGLRGDVYVYRERFNHIESVLYPVVSPDMINNIVAKLSPQKEIQGSLLEHSSLVPDSKIRVVVNWRGLAIPADSLEDWANENLGIEENDLSGIVLAGWDAISEDDTKLLKSMGVAFHEDLILIQKGAKPVSPFSNIIFLLLGIAGFYFLFIRPYIASREKTASNNLMETNAE